MGIPTPLAARIGGLTASIGADATVIYDPLTALIHDLKLAVHSYVGLQLSLDDHGHVISLTSFEDGAQAVDIQTTVRLPLTALSPLADPNSAILFYARNPGAFVDLAADLSYALQLPVGEQNTMIRLDQAVIPALLTSDLTGVAERSAINQAIGVLLGRGHHPDQTHRELHQQANGAGLTTAAYAARFLRTL